MASYFSEPLLHLRPVLLSITNYVAPEMFSSQQLRTRASNNFTILVLLQNIQGNALYVSSSLVGNNPQAII